MKVCKVKKSRFGVGYGLVAGLTWGMDTVLMGIIMSKTPFMDSKTAIMLAPLVSTFLHDFLSGIWVSLYLMFKGELGKVFKALKSKSGLYIVLGALLGGPIGMTAYLMSVKYIGPAYTASVTAVFPGISAVLAWIFLKEKMNKRIWCGVVISILGIVVLGYSPSKFTAGSDFLLGLLCALATVFAWSIESIICAYGMKYGELNPEHAINIRQLTSGIFYGVIILPLVKGYSLVVSAVDNRSILILIALTAFIGAVSYINYYKAINTIGAARSTALNITYGVWAIVIQVAFMGIQASFQLIAGCVIVLIGSVLVVGIGRK